MSITYLTETEFSIQSLIDEKKIVESDACDIELALELSRSNRRKKINFVGLIETPGRVLFSLPKFHYGKNETTAKLIIKLMRRISKENKNSKCPADAQLFDQKKNEGHLSRINIASFILEDFYTNGLLSIRRSYLKYSDTRTPDWGRTIQNRYALHSESGPIYEKWISKHTERTEHKVITEIHRAIVTKCSNLYGELAGYPSNPILGSSTRSTVITTALPILRSVMRRTFFMRETQILKALINWIEEEHYSGVKFFGTQYFHTIWEKICSSLFSDVKKSDNWKDVMPLPEWRIWKTSKVYCSEGKFIIDALTELPDKKGILLLDAKYYRVKPSQDGRVSGPGVGDISKQLHYEDLVFTSNTFTTLFGEDRSKIINCFVFPVGSNALDLFPFGEIKIPRITKNRIVCVNLSGVRAIQRYLNNQLFTHSELRDFNILIDQTTASLP